MCSTAYLSCCVSFSVKIEYAYSHVLRSHGYLFRLKPLYISLYHTRMQAVTTMLVWVGQKD